jgi:hypothetical protein
MLDRSMNTNEDFIEGACLGISTEAQFAPPTDWPRAISAGIDGGFRAIELSAVSLTELETVVEFLIRGEQARESLSAVEYVSLHAPVAELTSRPDLVSALAGLPPFVETVVVHPDLLGSLEGLHEIGKRLAIENMDGSKTDGRTPDELERFFVVLPEAGFCLDVAHAWSIDPTLLHAHALLDAFGTKLREVHVSGISPDGQHRPTTKNDLARYRSVLQGCRSVTWIFETPPLGFPDADLFLPSFERPTRSGPGLQGREQVPQARAEPNV